MYTGVGLVAGTAQIWDYDNFGLFASPQFIIGKEFITSEGEKQFFEVSIKAPMVLIDCDDWDTDIVEIPFISLKYGFAF